MTRSSFPFGRPVWMAVVLLLLGGAQEARAQAPLILVDEETSVGSIGFLFTGTQTFGDETLEEQIALADPTTWDRIRRVLPFLSPAPHPFAPLVLQRDVARLRQFYRESGFLQAQVDYPQTTLDTTSNTIDVVFSITEGPPLIIQDVGFFGPDTTDYAISQFAGELREAWIQLRDRISFRLGERYTDYARRRIEDEVLGWLQNHGFAFAQTGTVVNVDSTYNTADIRFVVDAGPRARVSEIRVEGNRSVSASLVRRELPFEVGDWYSYEEVVQGQGELFGLSLFRLALADLPEQPRDSSVVVRYRVREASLRYLTAQTGYARNIGLRAEGQWTHRNFFGGARTFSAGVVANTGLLAVPGPYTIRSRLFRASVSLTQPYLLTTRLSAVVSPFLQFEQDPFRFESDKPLDINAREYGLTTTLIYEFLPFRAITLRHTFSRVRTFTRPLPIADSVTVAPSDRYDKSILTLSATLGRADDYLNPRRGYLMRPFLEFGGGPLARGVQYVKLGNELTGYLPLTDEVSVAGRLFAGRLFPYGESSDQRDAAIENRFDPIRFYIGGPSDVRGWRSQLAGPKQARPLVIPREAVQEDTTIFVADTTGYVYEPVGGTAKLGFNAELRLPFPGLGSSWSTALFLDAGMVDEGFSLDDFRYGAGAGIRYRTAVGYLRLDIAYKLNPSFADLRDPEDVYEYRNRGGPLPEAEPLRRFRIHISIGQAF